MRAFLPLTDIFETKDALTVVLEMPAVARDNIELSVENGMVTVEGRRINFAKYEGLQPVYSEYNIGPYRRSFRVSKRVDAHKITAEKHDGVITLVLPKAEEAKPRRIEVTRPVSRACRGHHAESRRCRSIRHRWTEPVRPRRALGNRVRSGARSLR